MRAPQRCPNAALEQILALTDVMGALCCLAGHAAVRHCGCGVGRVDAGRFIALRARSDRSGLSRRPPRGPTVSFASRTDAPQPPVPPLPLPRTPLLLCAPAQPIRTSSYSSFARPWQVPTSRNLPPLLALGALGATLAAAAVAMALGRLDASCATSSRATDRASGRAADRATGCAAALTCAAVRGSGAAAPSAPRSPPLSPRHP